MVESDLVVLGAGPAGVGAALAASRHGLRVALIDDAPVAGGQVYKAPPSSFTVDDRRALGAEHQRGARLRDELAGSDVETYFGRTVWLVSRGFALEAVGPGGLESFRSKSLILATGTFERVIPFPGWTLPGVIGLGAATLLLKSQQMLPGRRTVVAGAGPLLLAVAAGVLKGGGGARGCRRFERPGGCASCGPSSHGPARSRVSRTGLDGSDPRRRSAGALPPCGHGSEG